MPEQANWSLSQKSPSGLSFDVFRSVDLPCPSGGNRPAVCLVHPVVSRGVTWHWSRTNIGHAAQYLFKCWSFFQRFPSLDRQIVDVIQGRMNFSQSWSVAMVKAMKATFVQLPPPRCAVVWSPPTRLWYPGYGESWFHSPRDAWQLTATVLGLPPNRGLHGGFLEPAGPAAQHRGRRAHPSLGVPHAAARVGVLERGAIHYSKQTKKSAVSRVWPAGGELVDLVRARRPAAVSEASQFYLHNMTLREQALKVREYDVIISTHGSQSVSLAFIRPCTVFLEILNEEYLISMFGQLAIESGGRAFFLQPGPSVDESVARTMASFGTKPTRESLKKMYYARTAAGFQSLGAEVVYAHLGALVEAHHRCLAGDEPEPAYDGVPTMGGADALSPQMRANASHCFHCGQGDRCCDSQEALLTYAQGGYACRQCQARFNNMSAREVCAAAAARECQLTDAHGVCWQNSSLWRKSGRLPPVSEGACPRTIEARQHQWL